MTDLLRSVQDRKSLFDAMQVASADKTGLQDQEAAVRAEPK